MKKTPRYIVDFAKFKENCEDIIIPFQNKWNNNVEFGYSVKTNRDARLIKFASNILKWNIEVVSPDEYRYCKMLGVPEGNIILNGPCKVGMIRKLDKLPRIINFDNYAEVEEFSSFFHNYDGLVGLRVNFPLEHRCPGETTAANEVSRFGIDVNSKEFLNCIRLLNYNGVNNIGLHMHTSTVSRSVNVFSELAHMAVELKKETKFDFSFIDMGGGFFGGQKVVGKPTMQQYANVICDILSSQYNSKATKLILEPGVSVLATCVKYETRIINSKSIKGTRVLTVDGSLLHINPFMKKRNQPFDVINDCYQNRKKIEKQIIGGATCMENDRLAILLEANELREGDLLSFKNVGAYTMGFNSHFILNPPYVEYIEGKKK